MITKVFFKLYKLSLTNRSLGNISINDSVLLVCVTIWYKWWIKRTGNSYWFCSLRNENVKLTYQCHNHSLFLFAYTLPTYKTRFCIFTLIAHFLAVKNDIIALPNCDTDCLIIASDRLITNENCYNFVLFNAKLAAPN